MHKIKAETEERKISWGRNVLSQNEDKANEMYPDFTETAYILKTRDKAGLWIGTDRQRLYYPSVAHVKCLCFFWIAICNWYYLASSAGRQRT